MKRFFWVLFLVLIHTMAFATETRLIEDFSANQVGIFPTTFFTFPFQGGKGEKVHHVLEESGNRYLNASDSQDLSVEILKKFSWDRNRWPSFSWRWRAKVLPKGAAENHPKTNDAACGVYVLFGGYTGHVIKYTWSSTLPVGMAVEKKKGRSFSVILESGPTHVGSWKEERVDVVADYRRLFGKEPTQDPSGFGLLTDGNATHSPAVCDYDDFVISSL